MTLRLAISEDGYPMDERNCLCDVEFVDWFKEKGMRGNVFHFGTGMHHYVGIELAKMRAEVFGITISKKEHDEYINLITVNPSLSNYYKVLFGDIYTLSRNCLPLFNIVNLAHIGEYYEGKPTRDYARHDDESLLNLFITISRPGTYFSFFTKSQGWNIGRVLTDTLRLGSVIRHELDYKRLRIYRKM